MDKYVCIICGYIYDPAEGDPENGIDPGTPFEELPEDWTCPACGVGKEYFEDIPDSWTCPACGVGKEHFEKE